MQITQNQNAIRIWKNLELNIIYAGHAIVGQDWKEPKVCSPFSRIYYIVDGEGILTVNCQIIVLKKGSVWLVPAGMTFGYFCESSMEQLFFHLNVLCSDGTDLLYGVRQLYERKEQTGEIARVKGLYQSETMTDAIRLQGMLWETLAGFLEQAKLDGEELKEHSPLIGQMFELAQNPVSAATHVRTLAQQLHVSESTLTRRFRAETGISPGEYLERLVAGQACRMLLSEDYSIAEIAEILHFSDQFYFCKFFKRHMNLTPSAYRRQMRKG